MPRFLVGDELGNIKSLQYSPVSQETQKSVLKTLHDGTSTGRTKGIQKLALSNAGEKSLVRSACSLLLVTSRVMLNESYQLLMLMGLFQSFP